MPLTVDVGLSQAFVWQTQAGNIVTTPLPAGVITGGGPRLDYAARRYRGIGLKESRRALLTKNQFDLKTLFTPETKTLVTGGNVVRSGSLTYLQFKGGAPQQAWFVQNAKINTCEFDVAGYDAPLECNLSFLGLTGVNTTNPANQTTGDVFYGFNLVLTIGGTDYGVQKFNAKVNNKLKLGSHFGTKSAGTLREPTYIIEGFEEHEISIETLMPTGFDPTADTPLGTIALVATFTQGANTLTLTYANLTYDAPSGNQDYKEEGEVTYKYKLIGGPGALTIS